VPERPVVTIGRMGVEDDAPHPASRRSQIAGAAAFGAGRGRRSRDTWAAAMARAYAGKFLRLVGAPGAARRPVDTLGGSTAGALAAARFPTAFRRLPVGHIAGAERRHRRLDGQGGRQQPGN